MGATLKIGEQMVESAELLPLLARHQLLPQLGREIIIDRAIAPITCSADEAAAVCAQFYRQHQITSDAERQQWLQRNNLQPEQLQEMAVRGLKIETFKQQTWGHKLESYFLKRKGKLDRVVYSLLRSQDAALAQELYFRIQAGEQTFEELAREYSQGSEARTGGKVGPVELSVPHPTLAKMLANSKPGQLWPPNQLGEWVVIVRLEQFLPAQLDETMRRRLLNECFNHWIDEQLQQMSVVPDSVVPDSVVPDSVVPNGPSNEVESEVKDPWADDQPDEAATPVARQPL